MFMAKISNCLYPVSPFPPDFWVKKLNNFDFSNENICG